MENDMRTCVTMNPNPGAPISDDLARETLRSIVIQLMDHGAVRLESGTLESAALIQASKGPTT